MRSYASCRAVMVMAATRPVPGNRPLSSIKFTITRDTVIFNVLGGIGTLVGPIVGAGFFQLLRELMARIFGDQFPYLVPLGFIFIAMIIFLPQGLLGFARRWLNR